MQDLQLDDNPYLQLEDPYEPYQKSADNLTKHDSEMMRDEQLCYEIFGVSENGKELMGRWEKNILMSIKVNPYTTDAMQVSWYWEAVRSFIIGIKQQTNNHLQRIQAIKK